jgi:hypothetical protein
MRRVSSILFILTFVACSSNRLIDVHDGFESNELSPIWSNKKFLPGAFEIQSTHVRSGFSAAKITLNPGDQIDDEKGTILERAELMEARSFMSAEDLNYSYSFSLFLPQDFPIVPTRLVIAQWKQDCKSENCHPENPVIALHYESGELKVTLQVGPKKITLYSQTEGIVNNWLDFRFEILFSRDQHGRIKAWLNDQQIVDYKGVTAYSKSYGYPTAGRFYFKMGLYRDKMEQPMTIYLDEYKKQQLLE